MGTINSDTLLVICQAAGILLLACTMLLIGLRRIYFDAKTKQPIEIELPLFGKVKTQAPAFALIVVGAFLVFYPTARPQPDMVTFHGSVDTKGKSVTVMVVVPQYQQVLDSPGSFHIPVQVIKDASYRVKFIVDKRIEHDEEPTRDKSGEFSVAAFDWSPPLPSMIVPTQTQKDVSDEELQRLGIH